MRRPSPLPQAPTPPTATDDGRRAADARAAQTPDAGQPQDAAQPQDAGTSRVDAAPHDASASRQAAALAPVLPLVAARPVLPPDLPAVDSGAVAADGEPQRDIRLRDVWKAARASRRALRAEVRRFTGRQRRRRLTWIVSAAAIVLLAVGAVGAAYSPLFAVERIRVVGAEQLDAASVEAALAGQLGTPLASVDESAVKAALVEFPLVETYTLEARPPHELVVRIVERTPIGLVETRAGFTLVDAAGVVLATTPDPVAGHPVVTVAAGTRSPAFAAVGQVMRTLPETIRAQVTAVAASTPDDVTLTLGGTNTQIVWGGPERSADKAIVLERMMVQRPPDTVSSYDVSSPSAIVVR